MRLGHILDRAPSWHDPLVTGEPWTGDACSLVDAFRRGERSPREELESSLAAIASSDLNAFSFLDPERALAAAERRRRLAPLRRRSRRDQGARTGHGLAATPKRSLVFKDRIATQTSTVVERLLGDGGAVPVGLTTASRIRRAQRQRHQAQRRHAQPLAARQAPPAARRPAARPRSRAGSSPLATGGDGGGSIRIPAGYTGLLGMKGTYGRIPRGPHAYFTSGHHRARLSRPLGPRRGPLLRRVRGLRLARSLEPPASAPNWEANLGTNELRGKRVAIVPNLGGVTLEPGVEEHLRDRGQARSSRPPA